MLAGSLGLAFFVYVLVNGGMISGLLPVVGIPMPLISYGGTSAVSLLAGIGLVMAVRGHRPVHGDRVSSQRRSPRGWCLGGCGKQKPRVGRSGWVRGDAVNPSLEAWQRIHAADTPRTNPTGF